MRNTADPDELRFDGEMLLSQKKKATKGKYWKGENVREVKRSLPTSMALKLVEHELLVAF